MDLIYRYDPFAPIVVNRPADVAAANQALVDGNRRLVEIVGKMQQATMGETPVSETIVNINPVSMGLPFLPGAALDQQPFALVLGCSDARVPIESIFDHSFNEMFVVRVAGNVLGTEGLGSFDYAVRHLGRGLKMLVVLGHTGCGAVTAAVDTYLAPNDYANIAYTYALRTLVDRVMVAVRGAAKSIDRVCGRDVHSHPNYRAALIDVAVYLNAAITAFDLRRELAAKSSPALAVHYGACDLQTMLVTSKPVTATTVDPDLRSAPQGASEFVTLGNELAEAVVANGVLA
jgi:carbonic anhydrase